jgi:hypothetical protein
MLSIEKVMADRRLLFVVCAVLEMHPAVTHVEHPATCHAH